MNFFQSLIYGIVAGLSDLVPVSSRAHKAVLLKLFGQAEEPAVMRLVIDIAILAAMYYHCAGQLKRLWRQQKLSKIPKRRRKHPVDLRSIMDFRLLMTMIPPVVLGFLIHFKTAAMEDSLAMIAAFLVINGVLLFLPCLLPAGNKDSRAMSRLDGLVMGLGATAASLPGISDIGAASSIAMVRGTDREYAVQMAVLMHLGVTVGAVIYDFVALILAGTGSFGFAILVSYLAAGLAAFVGAGIGIRMVKALSVHKGLDILAYYCWGIAFLAFILFLSV